MIAPWPPENSLRPLTDSKYSSRPSERRESTSSLSAITPWANTPSSSLCAFGVKTALSNWPRRFDTCSTLKSALWHQTPGKRYDVSVRDQSVLRFSLRLHPIRAQGQAWNKGRAHDRYGPEGRCS